MPLSKSVFQRKKCTRKIDSSEFKGLTESLQNGIGLHDLVFKRGVLLLVRLVVRFLPGIKTDPHHFCTLGLTFE